ncbi:hypothetical protein BDW02DRAFT_578972 [Decorospora gaudefroyi]|uniref:Cytosolic endo-beta-N-acetylglucosaminidase TIM barrel domain-containing protein n=1 Tax=Decorospora gaudefroyi TaxID=184978 RepID=A0A6A5KNU5_9PLEO|nr:hypothetical protein BDW02DRAFT_578972 [Decorospora gaudefroyi]
MAYLLGWKDILRPIRDGYRHLFPSPDTGPTPEERRKQRDLDRLKGFTYFDTFDQLEAWTEANSDPLQRSNTPLLTRADDVDDGPGKANVLLIHDYSGNYHEYESVQGIGVADDMYACEYLQHVDTFIYFSHKLVCVPPPTWSNTVHRNGVRVLGTLLIEPQTEGWGDLLKHTTDNDGFAFPMVKTLVGIATHYGFDGWLVNIENPFPKDTWNPDILEAFLCQLKAQLGESRQLIWYDALTTSNKISYQNALSANNLPFAEACGSILTNYCWTAADAEKSLQLALSRKLLPQNILFGIDVWAQNTSSFTHPRVTYPEYGGGGTNTGVAVAKLAEFGLSAGIFAPAWSFEHFPGHGRDVEHAVWEGCPLTDDVECSCGDCTSRHRPNNLFPILKNARERSAGSENFFYTDFSRAFGMHENEEREFFNGHSMHAQLGTQAILPRPPLPKSGKQTIELSHRLEHAAHRTRLVIEAKKASSGPEQPREEYLPLFKINIAAKKSLCLEITSRNNLPPASDAVVCFYLKTTEAIHFHEIPPSDSTQKSTSSVEFSTPGSRVQGLGMYIRGLPNPAVGETTKILEVLEIRIASKSPANPPPPSYLIRNVRFENRAQRAREHTRLCWDYDDREQMVKDVPYSHITGPFSHFSICVDGVRVGRAYALEHPLNEILVERLAGKEVVVEVVGVSFDGLMRALIPQLSKPIYKLSKPRTQSRPANQLFALRQTRQLSAPTIMASPAKRKAQTHLSLPNSKKSKIVVPEYHLTPSRRDESGEVVWPARKEQIECARKIIRQCAEARKPTVILPDKDADGLSSGAILQHTLTSLGLPPELISVYFPPKGSNVHDESTKKALTARSPSYIFVLDQGSRKTPPIIDSPHTCLVIDHHFAESGFPEGSDYVTAYDCPPVATSALLTYHICLPLDPDLSDQISWLAILGTYGDLGTAIKWEPPFPDMTATLKHHSRAAIGNAVTLVNAPRRSAAYNVEDAWNAVISASDPKSIHTNEKLHETSVEVRRATEHWTHTAPKFSADATIAVLMISSAAQIHPVIATRWANTLRSNKLEIVMCANEGYLPDKINFSCRVAIWAQAREGEDKVDIIKKLESIVAEDKDLRARLGENFARGHKQASGGIVGKQEWEEFKKLMGVGEGAKKTTDVGAKKEKPTQKNILTNYFAKTPKVQGV